MECVFEVSPRNREALELAEVDAANCYSVEYSGKTALGMVCMEGHRSFICLYVRPIHFFVLQHQESRIIVF